MTDSPRQELIEIMVRAVIEDDDYWAEPEATQNCREEQGRALDAVLANRELLFEVLGGTSAGEHEYTDEPMWRFPA